MYKNIFTLSACQRESLFKKFSQKMMHGYKGIEGEVEELLPSYDSVNTTTFGVVKTTRHGIFLSDSEEFASQYGKVNKYEINLEDPAEMTDDLKYEFIDTIDPYKDREIWLLAKHTRNDWGFFEGELGSRFVEFLKRSGYDGVIFPETLEYSGGEYEGNTIVVFDSSQLRKI